MERQTLNGKQSDDVRSTVDTSRAFSSVREAVAIFGERLFIGELYSRHNSLIETPSKQEASFKFSAPSQEKEYSGDHQQSNASWKRSPSPLMKPEQEDKERTLFESVRKLEAELEETKEELNLLKKRENETEVGLATLNAELHASMSKLAKAEAIAAATRAASFERVNREANIVKDEKMKDLMIRVDDSQTLAQILSMEATESYLITRKRERKLTKKKPIIPLVADLFSKRKTDNHNPVYSSPYFL